MSEPIANQAYDQMAEAYARKVDTKPHNAYYDRPAVQSLLTDLTGKTVLDAACGTGVYTEWLLAQGAEVVGVEANERMLAYARERNAGKAVFYQANLEQPLDMLADAQFDGIVSALTISYIRDLERLFGEFRRVLKPGGWLVFSIEHPFSAYQYFKVQNYYTTQQVSCIWRGFGEPVEVKSYYHSLATITEALAVNGFWIERIIEPLPTEEFGQTDPEGYQELLTFPGFIFVRATVKLAA